MLRGVSDDISTTVRARVQDVRDRFNPPERHLGVGGDFGGTSARIAIVDKRTGETLAWRAARHAEANPQNPTAPETIADEMAALVRGAADDYEARTGRRLNLNHLSHVSVIGPGARSTAVDAHGETVTRLEGGTLGWGRPVAIGEMIRERLGVKTLLDNDILGPAKFALDGHTNALLVTIGTGLGAALKDRGHFSPYEISQVIVNDPWGGRVRLEDAVSGSGFERGLAALDTEGGAALDGIRKYGGLHAGSIEAAYQAHDPFARALWERCGELLGAQLVNEYRQHPNLTKVVFGGGCFLQCPGLQDEVIRAFDRNLDLANSLSPASRASPKPTRDFFGVTIDEAGALGAARFEPSDVSDARDKAIG